MTFVVSSDAYDRYVGRYLPELADALADAAGVRPGQRALDVGCGPGGLTRELAARLGAGSVCAIDPSPPFVAACGDRHPGVEVVEGVAESLPYPDGSFDVALASLVVPFMSDALAGVGEMRRVTRPGGAVAACVWDYGGGMTMLRVFWDAAVALDPEAPHESGLLGGTEGQLGELFRAAGLRDVEEGALVASAGYEDFDDWWKPFMLGVGPGGAYCVSLDDRRRAALREDCRRRLGSPAGPFRQTARAWYAVGRA